MIRTSGASAAPARRISVHERLLASRHGDDKFPGYALGLAQGVSCWDLFEGKVSWTCTRRIPPSIMLVT